MAMPNHLIVIRHGESVGNVARGAASRGDESHFTDAFVTTPGREWDLTDVGRAQVATAGAWLRELLAAPEVAGPRRFYASPYRRTMQTAGHLGLLDDDGASVRWYLNRTLRERDWGEIESMPRSVFEASPLYAANVRKRSIDPLYWRPPGGESLCDVAENRVRNFLDTLHRECSGQSVVAVTHGEFMHATRVVLERVDDRAFGEWEDDDAQHIHHCEVLHYSRVTPAGAWPTTAGARSRRIEFLRRAHPIQVADGVWSMRVGPWMRFGYHRPTNADLLGDNGV